MNRISEIVSFIDDNDIVADIGCDQAGVGIMLANKGIKSYGLDISVNVIKKAQEKINSLNLQDYISLKVSDGLDKVTNDVDTIVLAGMGSYNIVSILSKASKKYKKVITISNTDHSYLREELSNLGYNITNEKIIIERGKYYNLIIFSPGNDSYSEKELLIGVNMIKDENYSKWVMYNKSKYKKIQMNSEFTNDNANLMIKYLDDEM